MNIRQALLVFLLPFTLLSCKNEIYEVNEVIVPRNTIKDNQKSNQQYVAVSHANLFQAAASPNEMVEIDRVIRSIGDKELVYELIISSFMNESAVVVPTNGEMRDDVSKFIEDTYERFYVRPPAEIEREYWINYIEANPEVTPELVYVAFAISDEYFFY